MADYILYTHTDPEIKTIDNFLRPGSITILSKEKLLSYTVDGVSNLTRIYKKYTLLEQLSEKKRYDAGILTLLKINTVLAIPKDENINIEVLATIGKNQVVQEHDFDAFFADKLKSLYTDKNYTISIKDTKDIRVFASVWIWCRSIEKLINVTSFVNRISTNVTKTGGNFGIDLMPIVDLKNPKQNTLYKSYKNRNNFYFHKHISTNDLVFIRYERLTLELTRSQEANDFFLDPSVLFEKTFDMMGLVDKNVIETSANDISIQITGRDFIKLLIEDGSYFIPIQFATSIIANVQDDKKLINRINGTYHLFSLKTYQSIRNSIQFIINHLSNIGIVPDKVFSKYGDRRTMVYRDDKGGVVAMKSYKDSKKQQTADVIGNVKETLASGIWQVIKVLIDENVADRRITDSSISQPDGSLLNQINKLCQDQFVEFFTDTYGDEFYMIVRQLPFNKEAIQSVIKKGVLLDIEDDNVLQDSLMFDETNIYSWYQMEAKGLILGSKNKNSLAIIPAIYLPQYANIWGSRRLAVVSNYVPYSGYIGKAQEEDRRYINEQVINDYKFLLDVNVCNPFLRKGTITLNGDRRIKRGTYIRLKSTKEIYYVDSVSNSISISENSVDRSTTIQVSRGMKEEYINGKNLTINGITSNMSYFNIVDTTYIANALKDRVNKTASLKVRKDFGVNEPVFNFFLSGGQME